MNSELRFSDMPSAEPAEPVPMIGDETLIDVVSGEPAEPVPVTGDETVGT